MEKKVKKVKVTILGKSYLLSTDENEENIIKLAQDIDSQMKEIANKSSIKDGYSIAVITALQIAQKLEVCRKELNMLRSQAASLDSLLDEQIS